MVEGQKKILEVYHYFADGTVKRVVARFQNYAGPKLRRQDVRVRIWYKRRRNRTKSPTSAFISKDRVLQKGWPSYNSLIARATFEFPYIVRYIS